MLLVVLLDRHNPKRKDCRKRETPNCALYSEAFCPEPRNVDIPTQGAPVHETASLKKGAGHPRTMVKFIGVGVACVGIVGYVIYRNQSNYPYVDPESKVTLFVSYSTTVCASETMSALGHKRKWCHSPFFRSKQTFASASGTSAMCHLQTTKI
jgi:hypothetical protein